VARCRPRVVGRYVARGVARRSSMSPTSCWAVCRPRVTWRRRAAPSNLEECLRASPAGYLEATCRPEQLGGVSTRVARGLFEEASWNFNVPLRPGDPVHFWRLRLGDLVDQLDAVAPLVEAHPCTSCHPRTPLLGNKRAACRATRWHWSSRAPHGAATSSHRHAPLPLYLPAVGLHHLVRFLWPSSARRCPLIAPWRHGPAPVHGFARKKMKSYLSPEPPLLLGHLVRRARCDSARAPSPKLLVFWWLGVGPAARDTPSSAGSRENAYVNEARDVDFLSPGYI